jgi:hypothetical protein
MWRSSPKKTEEPVNRCYTDVYRAVRISYPETPRATNNHRTPGGPAQGYSTFLSNLRGDKMEKCEERDMLTYMSYSKCKL